MIYFLTSSHCVVGETRLNPANGFVDQLKEVLDEPFRMLVVASDPEDGEQTDQVAEDTVKLFADAGMEVSDFVVLDRRNQEDAAELVAEADFIYFMGGHVPTENAFLHEIGMRELMEEFDGVVMGVSAGSMNCADVVYAQPEEEGEATDPAFDKFPLGLGITQTQILPHYQQVKDNLVDGLHLYWDISVPDSEGGCFIAMVDGTYIFGIDGLEELRGEAYLLEDGTMRKISNEGDVVDLDWDQFWDGEEPWDEESEGDEDFGDYFEDDNGEDAGEEGFEEAEFPEEDFQEEE